jgi:hypothetical protein
VFRVIIAIHVGDLELNFEDGGLERHGSDFFLSSDILEPVGQI